MLLAYKIHMGEKSAWINGIHGSGNAYGSVFHKHISRVFFDAASKPYHPLHDNITHAVSVGGLELESIIRENIFIPFIENNCEKFSSGQIISMAKGVTVWVKAMSEFFRYIPSLRKNSDNDISSIFIKPEQTLQSRFILDDGCLIITGRYDALLFNPDETEARLFEFKGYMKSDITVPLSQSLIYSWLIWRKTGIVPSVEIIYLDEGDKQPDIFDSKSVAAMMTPALPELFRSAFNILTLRRKPEILQDKDLCTTCRYREHCKRDMANLFAKTKRTGASLVNVLIFFLISLVITAQAFFFLENFAEVISDKREMMQIRLKLDTLVDEAKDALNSITPHLTSISMWGQSDDFYIYGKKYALFSDLSGATPPGTKVWESGDEKISAGIFDLYYTFMNDNDNANALGETNFVERETKDLYRRIYPALGENYFLIRARVLLPTGDYIMRQLVIKKGNTKPKSEEEVFYYYAP